MSIFVIDVREPHEYLVGHIKGAINIPSTKLSNDLESFGSIPKDAEIVLYCRTGARAGKVKYLLDQAGYRNVTNGINIDSVIKAYDQRM